MVAFGARLDSPWAEKRYSAARAVRLGAVFIANGLVRVPGAAVAAINHRSAAAVGEDRQPRSSTGLSSPRQILVNDNITHGPHLCPRKLGILLEVVGRHAVDVTHGLTNDFDVTHNRVLDLRVFPEASYSAGAGYNRSLARWPQRCELDSLRCVPGSGVS